VIRGEGEYEVLTMLTDEVFVDATNKAAGHHEDGVYFAWGPSVEPGAETRDATVVDVVPTLLHALGEPVPEYVDGRVLEEIFDADSAAATRSVETAAATVEHESTDDGTDDDEDMDEVEDRLGVSATSSSARRQPLWFFRDDATRRTSGVRTARTRERLVAELGRPRRL